MKFAWMKLSKISRSQELSETVPFYFIIDLTVRQMIKILIKKDWRLYGFVK